MADRMLVWFGMIGHGACDVCEPDGCASDVRMMCDAGGKSPPATLSGTNTCNP